MKKIVKYAVMVLMVSVSGFVKAQSGPKGHGFLKGIYQQTNIPDATVDQTCRDAGIALFSHDKDGIKKYFNVIPGWSYDQMREAIREYLKIKLDRSILTDAEMVSFFRNLSFCSVGTDHWVKHLSGYLKENQVGIYKWNPTKSTKYHRTKFRMGYTLRHGDTTYLLMAHCMNLDYLRSPQSIDRYMYNNSGDDGEDLDDDTGIQANSNTAIGNNNNQLIITGDGNIVNINPKPAPPVSVVVREPLNPTDEKAANDNTDCHTLRTVAIVGSAVVAAVVIVKYVVPLFKSKAVKKDNSYSNGWIQDGGSSPYPVGSGSGTPNGPTIP